VRAPWPVAARGPRADPGQGWPRPAAVRGRYRNIGYTFSPADPPHVPHDDNPTGCYRTTFTLPANWASRPVLIEVGSCPAHPHEHGGAAEPARSARCPRGACPQFEGVKSAYYVWCNGVQIGFSKDSMTASEFDLSTTVFRDGRANLLAVEVIRWSDGSYLEKQAGRRWGAARAPRCARAG